MFLILPDGRYQYRFLHRCGHRGTLLVPEHDPIPTAVWREFVALPKRGQPCVRCAPLFSREANLIAWVEKQLVRS